MGDVIALEPTVSSLLARGRRVVLCAKSAWRGVLPRHARLEWIEADLPWTRYAGREKYRPSSYRAPGFREALERLRSVAPSAIGVDLRGDVRSMMLLWAAGVPRLLALSHYVGTEAAIPAYAATLVHASSRQPRWRQNLAVLEPLGCATADAVRPPRIARARPAREASGVPTVGVIPLAPWAGKHWPLDRWRALRTELAARGIETAALCGPGQARAVDAIFEGALRAVECTGIDAWIDAVDATRCIVSVNTGPMHLAAALGHPLVLLNGSSALPLWAPTGDHVHVLHHQDVLPCAPCHEVHDGRHCGFRCMALIGVEEVLARIHDVLREAPASAPNAGASA